MRLYNERTQTSGRLSRVNQIETHAGAAHVAVILLLGLSLLSAGLYVYTVNRSAVQGYAIRTLEKELKELKKANAELRVLEAEAKSLVRVEAGSQELRMERAETDTVIADQPHTFALR